MSIFFFNSGYLFFRNLTKNNLLEKLKSRFWSLLVPYLLWNLISYIINVVLFKVQFSITGLLKGLVFLLRPVEIHPSNTPTWYLMRIISYLLFSPIVLYVYRHFKKMALVFLIGFVIVNMLFTPDYYSWEYWAPLFYLGGWLSFWHKERCEEWMLGQCSNFYLLLCVILFGCGWWLYTYISFGSVRYILRLASGMIVFIVVRHLNVESSIAKQIKRDMNFWIYLTHTLISGGIKAFVIKRSGYLTSYFLSFLFMTLFCVLTYLILRKTRIYNILVGKRK